MVLKQDSVGNIDGNMSARNINDGKFLTVKKELVHAFFK